MGNQATASSESAGRARQFGAPEIVGQITSRSITESSGLAASKCASDILWTHNDSGDRNLIFAIDSKGTMLGKWKVTGAENKDWEDIASIKDASGKCFLFIGDIGNNSSKKSVFTVYKVEEPVVQSGGSEALATVAAQPLRFRYPDGDPDAEALLIHPISQEIFVITKKIIGAAAVYRVRGEYGSDSIVVAEKVDALTVPAIPDGLITGGDISPDGLHLALCDYFGGYEFTLPSDARGFEEIFTQKARKIDLGQRAQGESIAYSKDGSAIYATSEKRNSPLIRVTID